jgi:hypothetical protein
MQESPLLSKLNSIGVFLILTAVGCQSATVTEPVVSKFGGAEPDAQLEFWHQLAEKPVTCNDDAFHGLLLYVDGKDDSADYAGRVNSLKSRSMLPADFNQPGNQAVTRGNLAVAITRALQIKGGVMLSLLGTSPRYATRELIYQELYPPSSPNQTFSGSEFLGIMGRVEDWQRGNQVDVPAEVMPGEAK